MTMMELSFSTNAFVRYTVCHAVERIASVGYKGVELLADAPHLYADAVTRADVEQLKRVLARTGLTVANINANTAVGYYQRDFWEPLFEPSLANPDPNLRHWRIDYTKKCIDLANQLGANCISITSGKPVPGVAPTRSLDLLRESLKELVAYAAGRCVRIGIEYEPSLLVERYEELVDMLREIDSPCLGANLDLGHSHVQRESAEAVISGLSGSIFHIHMEDIRGSKHYHLIPGQGDMDFAALFSTLEDNGYNGFVTVELYTYPHEPESAAQQAFAYLQTVLQERHRYAEGRMP